MTRAPRLITIEFLAWVAAAPRRIALAREAWRSTCPLTCAWEDAFNDGLVALATGNARTDRASVVLTPHGRDTLAASGERREPTPPPFSLDPAATRL